MADTLGPGSIILHYRIVSKIGAGGMGEVYLAEDTELERRVALKILRSEIAGDEDRVRRFVQEAKAASALNHPNILTVFETGNFYGSRYIATEFIKGQTLRDRFRGEPFTLGETLDIASQIAAAMSAAHDANIIHRDIKPENIMLREDGLVKILDFGLAKLSEPTEPVAGTTSGEDATLVQINTQPGVIIGTVAYMSPEQARGQRLDARTDIFSLGIVMFELFTGRRPFEGETQADLISSILKDEPPLIRQISPGLPLQLERLVSKTLRKDRDHRYQHVKDLQIDIEDIRDEMKFEEKLNLSTQNTVERVVHSTNQSGVRTAFTTGISKTPRFTVLHALIFVVAVAAIVSGMWFFLPGATAPTTPGSYKITEVASWSSAAGELFSNATFSPDSKMIAFASTRSGSKNIWVTQTGSTEAIQVTNDEFSNTQPVWSPKGDEIAYFSERGPNSGVWRVSALGGTPRLIAPLTQLSSRLRLWAASGRIYYQLNGELHAIETASGISQKITSFGRNDITFLSISPDEKSMAYASHNGGAWQLFLDSMPGGKPDEIAKGSGTVSGIVWQPAKNRIFYSAPVDGIAEIFAHPLNSGRSVRITATETDSSVVDASSDGRSILSSSAKEESNLWRVDNAGGQDTPMARDLNVKLWPAVSPDNQKAAFHSVKNMSQGNRMFDGPLVVKSIKQRDDNERAVTLVDQGGLPAWSPDGSVIAFVKQHEGKTELFSINPSGGAERKLTAGGITIPGYSLSPYNLTQTRAYTWSPDGAVIAYISTKNGAPNVWFINVGNGSDTVQTANSDKDTTFQCPLWSRDGKNIAFSFQKTGNEPSEKAVRGLNLINRDSGVMTEVYRSEKAFRLIGWSADESGVIIAEPSKEFSGLPPETRLIRISLAGGKETSIANLNNIYFYNIFLSDDGKYIAFAARDQNMDNIWIIPAGGGTPRKLTSNNDSGLYYSRLAWLHDGSAIVFGKQTRFSLLSIITDIN